MKKIKARKIDLVALGVLILTVTALIGVFGGVKEINWVITFAIAVVAISFLFRYAIARIIVITRIIPKRMAIG